MKKHLIFPILISFAAFTTSCNRAELDQSNQTNDSLRSVVSEREAALTEFIESFNELEQNLDSVAARQHIVTVTSDQKGELQRFVR